MKERLTILRHHYRLEFGFEFQDTFRHHPVYILPKKQYDEYLISAIGWGCKVTSSIWSDDTKATIDDGKGKTKHTIIRQDKLRLAPDPFDGEIKLMLPQEYARQVLRYLYGHELDDRCKNRKWRTPLADFNGMYQNADGLYDHKLMRINPPQYFGGKSPKMGMVYFDLFSAYARIYERLTLDTLYPRGLGTLGLHETRMMTEFAPIPHDENDENDITSVLRFKKFARNSVIGIIAGRHMKKYSGGGFKDKKIQFASSLFWSPALWFTIQAILHEIAIAAVRWGAIYVGTDCYIFPRASQWQFFESWMLGNNLQHHKKQGIGKIHGWQAYELYYIEDNQKKSMIKNKSLIEIWESPTAVNRFKRKITTGKNPTNLVYDHGIEQGKWLKWWARKPLAKYKRVAPPAPPQLAMDL